MRKRLRLQDQVAVITGAAGGIGGACVAHFTGEGARVAALDCAPLAAAPGVLAITCDVAAPEDLERAVARIRGELGDAEIVVHCAAVSETCDTLSTTRAGFERIMRVNVWSLYNLAQMFVPGMSARGGGAIIVLSSITGIVGAPGLSAYSASKGALITLTRTLALELAASNVRVNAICPASVDTPLLQASFDATPDPGAARARNIERHPLGRLGTPADIASLAVFLASGESSWITGSTYTIDGGASIARGWKE
jgi:NAD(P)-dependent dehydrogenase (short-subunit alcohol dehydrogenase family)